MPNVELDTREHQRFRLRKLNMNQIQLANKLRITTTEMSLYFSQNAYPELEKRVESLIQRIENKQLQSSKEQ